MATTIIPFPRRDQVLEVNSGASWWTILKSKLAIRFFKFLNWLGIPGAIVNAEIEDQVSGQHILVMVGPLFTRISVNGRDFYFHRLSGRFGGTGQGCR